MFLLTVFSDEMEDKIEKLQDFVDDQVEDINDSIEDSSAQIQDTCREFIEKLRMDQRKDYDLGDFEAYIAYKKDILLAIEENVARMLKHQKLASQIENDLTRLELFIRSIYRVKLSMFWFCFEAIIGMILIPLGFPIHGYLLNLIAILKILFAFLELSGLRNWQRNKVLANLVIHLMEPLVWLIYTGYLLMTMGTHGTICLALNCSHTNLKMLLNPFDPESVHMQIWNQYSDMKKARPIIPNFGAFPA